MKGGGSPRPYIQKIQKLIEDYMEGSGFAKIELSNELIRGEDLVVSLEDIKNDYLEYEETEKNYEKAIELFKKARAQTQDLREKQTPILKEKQEFIKDLEKMLEGFKGPTVDDIKELLNEYK